MKRAGTRPIYAHSVVPGWIYSPEELKQRRRPLAPKKWFLNAVEESRVRGWRPFALALMRALTLIRITASGGIIPTLKHTITYRTEAYGTFLKHLELLSGRPDGQAGPLDPNSGRTFRRWFNAMGVQLSRRKTPNGSSWFRSRWR